MQVASSIRAVLMLMRHGNRNPIGTYPKDPHAGHKWPGGMGSLTAKGKEQMITSGRAKATRYRSLLKSPNGNIDINKIRVISSHVQRCVDSAKYFIDGILDTSSWPSHLINVIPHEEDTFISIEGKPHPKTYETIHKFLSLDNPEIKLHFKTSKNYQKILQSISTNTGLEFKSLGPFLSLDDLLGAQLENGLKLPSWSKSAYPKYIIPVAKLLYQNLGSSNFMAVRSGVLLKNMIDRLDEWISVQGSSTANIVLYSSHDLVISALMSYLNFVDLMHERIDYGAILSMELHENPITDDRFEIKIFYFRSYADRNPIELKIPNCEKPCSYRNFKTSIKDKLVMNYEDACERIEV